MPPKSKPPAPISPSARAASQSPKRSSSVSFVPGPGGTEQPRPGSAAGLATSANSAGPTSAAGAGGKSNKARQAAADKARTAQVIAEARAFAAARFRRIEEAAEARLGIGTARADGLAAPDPQSAFAAQAPPGAAAASPGGCPEHEGAPFSSYCYTCGTPICSICAALNHADRAHHEVESLADFTKQLVANVTAVDARNRDIAAQLARLASDLPAEEQRLHAYIDAMMDELCATLEDKRQELHAEAGERRLATLRALHEELALCQNALRDIDDGCAVLAALSAGTGTFATPAGRLIHGSISYDRFLAIVDAPLLDPPRVDEALLLQLPMQSLQEVCEMVTWTDASLNATPQVFPR